MKYIIKLHVFAIVLLLASCGTSKLEPLRPDSVIVAFGDSLTAGIGTDAKYSYPSVLERLSGIKVINAGISGETTAEGLRRFSSVLMQHSPDLLILIEGGNDILRNHNKADTKHNLEQMIQLARSQNIEIVLLGVPEKSLFSSSAPFYTELAQTYDLVFDAEIISSLMRSPSKKSDAVHFNRDGYYEMARTIYELLLDNGAL